MLAAEAEFGKRDAARRGRFPETSGAEAARFIGPFVNGAEAERGEQPERVRRRALKAERGEESGNSARERFKRRKERRCHPVERYRDPLCGVVHGRWAAIGAGRHTGIVHQNDWAVKELARGTYFVLH